MAGVVVVLEDFNSFPYAPLDVVVLHGWQFRPSDVFWRFDGSLLYILVLLGAAFIPGCVHAKPRQSLKEDKVLVYSPWVWRVVGKSGPIG